MNPRSCAESISRGVHFEHCQCDHGRHRKLLAQDVEPCCYWTTSGISIIERHNRMIRSTDVCKMTSWNNVTRILSKIKRPSIAARNHTDMISLTYTLSKC